MPTKLTLMALAGAMLASAQNQYPFQNPNLAIEERVDNTLSLMTLDEKLACLNTNTGVPRLGIPNAGNSEGLHGLVRRAQGNEGGIPTTSFAQVIGMSETWDPALIGSVGSAQGYEARYITQNERYKRPVLVVCVRTPIFRAILAGAATKRATARTRFSPVQWRRRSPKGCRATIRNTGKRRRC